MNRRLADAEQFAQRQRRVDRLDAGSFVGDGDENGLQAHLAARRVAGDALEANHALLPHSFPPPQADHPARCRLAAVVRLAVEAGRTTVQWAAVAVGWLLDAVSRSAGRAGRTSTRIRPLFTRRAGCGFVRVPVAQAGEGW